MKLKKVYSLLLAFVMVCSLTACGSGKNTSNKSKDTGESAGKTTTSLDFDKLKVGDNADLKADLKVITHRTDIIDTKFKSYIEQFQKIYPNITIKYEGITNYTDDMPLRFSDADWGDICMIPTAVNKSEFSTYFVPFGSYDTLSKKYQFLNDKTYEGTVYGIPSTNNVQGIVYNKAVFKKAGITKLPTTPEEFIKALQAIKGKTDAIPLYTNYAADWTMTAWDAYIGGSATGDADFMNIKLLHAKDPFSDRKDGTGPYAVYKILYDAVSKGLSEDDPSTSDWESSKGMINNGEIGCMVLGSWAIPQMAGAGDHADDIAYMPFPITVGGKQYAGAGADYCYGINNKSTEDEKLAAMYYVKWLTETSNYAYSEGGIPTVVGAEYPTSLKAFEKTTLVVDSIAKQGEEAFLNDLNTESELGINTNFKAKKEIVEIAMQKKGSFDDLMASWNKKWTKAQKSLGIKQE